MKRRLLEILACPIDKSYPLELYAFEELEEISSGIMICSKCNRWYPIIDEIPHMLPDDLRDESHDVAFLQRWREKIPTKILTEGKPFRLNQN